MELHYSRKKKVSAVASGIVLGVQNVADRTAKTTLATVEEELQRIATIAADLGIPPEITLSKVVSSTSDGAATQTKFLQEILSQAMQANEQ